MTTYSLKNHFLIAMPGLTDSRFSKTVTYICEHNEGGAMGIVINQPASISYSELFSQLKLGENIATDEPLLLGGPVKKERGFGSIGSGLNLEDKHHKRPQHDKRPLTPNNEHIVSTGAAIDVGEATDRGIDV